MNSIKNWIQRNLSRRGFIFLAALGLYHIVLEESAVWAWADYQRVQEFPIRSIEGTKKVDLKTWRLKIEGLVDKPISLTFDEIKILPQKIETKNFICVEGWGLDNQKWEGVHLKGVFSRVKISPEAKFVTFHAVGGQYKDSLSLKEAVEPDTMLSSKKVLMLYYSRSGNTKKMAEAIADVMKSSAVNVTIEDLGKLDISLLPNYDGIVLGSPTYFSNMAWQVKKVIDESIVHYSGRKLKGKVAGIFTSAGTSRNGKDCQKMLEVALGFHHGMKVVQGIIRVDGESDKEIEKRCQEYGNKLVKEIEK